MLIIVFYFTSSGKWAILGHFYLIPSQTKTLISANLFLTKNIYFKRYHGNKVFIWAASCRVRTLFTKQMFYMFIHKLFSQKTHFRT